MITDELFDHFFGDDHSDLPRPIRAIKVEDCKGKHQLVEIGRQREIIDFTNKHGTPLRGFRTWVVYECEKCGEKERFIPLEE